MAGLFRRSTDPNAPKSEGIILFLEIFFRKFWRLIQVNLMYIVALIPTTVLIFFLSGVISNAALDRFADGIMQISGVTAQDYSNADYSMTVVIIDVGLRMFATICFTAFWGMGPATAGLTYIMRCYAKEENSFIWTDFKDSIKENWKQSLVVFIIDVFAMFAFFYAIVFYSSLDNFMSYLTYVILGLLFFYTMIHFFIYPLMVGYKLKLSQIYKNAALFCLISLPFSLLVLVILALLTFGVLYLAVFVFSGVYTIICIAAYLIVVVFLLYSLVGLIVNYNAVCQINKYMDKDSKVEEKM